MVEGDSAGQRQNGRDKRSGWPCCAAARYSTPGRSRRDRLFANTEIHDIAVAISGTHMDHGVRHTRIVSNLRYGKVLHLSDADVDGSHIQVLLLTLFFRHFPQLIDAGHVYVARPHCSAWMRPARGKTRRAGSALMMAN